MRKNFGAPDQYKDILNLPHHISAVHPQMSALNRAAQFSPFAALSGYAEVIQEESRLVDEFTELEEDSLSMLNWRLEQLQEQLGKHPKVTITFFQPDEKKAGGTWQSVSGTVRRIDVHGCRIIMADGTHIPMEHILQIEGEWFDFG